MSLTDYEQQQKQRIEEAEREAAAQAVEERLLAQVRDAVARGHEHLAWMFNDSEQYERVMALFEKEREDAERYEAQRIEASAEWSASQREARKAIEAEQAEARQAAVTWAYQRFGTYNIFGGANQMASLARLDGVVIDGREFSRAMGYARDGNIVPAVKGAKRVALQTLAAPHGQDNDWDRRWVFTDNESEA